METTRDRIDELLEAARYCDLDDFKSLGVSLNSKDSQGPIGPMTYGNVWSKHNSRRNVKQGHLNSLPLNPPTPIDRRTWHTEDQPVPRAKVSTRSRDHIEIPVPNANRNEQEQIEQDMGASEEYLLRPHQRRRTSRSPPQTSQPTEQTNQNIPSPSSGLCFFEQVADVEYLELLRGMNLDEAVNQAGAVFTEFCAYILHLSDLASTAEAKLVAMEIDNNTKAVTIRDLEIVRDRLGDEVDKLKRNLAQSANQLKTSEDKILELQKKVEELSIAHEEAMAEQRAMKEENNFHKSENFRQQIISDYKSSSQYNDELTSIAVAFLDRGMAHVIRQLHHHFSDKSLLVQAYENSYDVLECRSGADFVPYQSDELISLKAKDAKQGAPEWVPPTPLQPTFWDLTFAPSPFPERFLDTDDIIHVDPTIGNTVGLSTSVDNNASMSP